jgi:hypothetical protein
MQKRFEALLPVCVISYKALTLLYGEKRVKRTKAPLTKLPTLALENRDRPAVKQWLVAIL